MSNQNNGETHTKTLTHVCQNVCAFIEEITIENMSKDDQINSFKTKIDDLQHCCSKLKTKLMKIDEYVKTLASSLNFAIDQDESTVNLLTRWNLSLLKKNVYSKKRKLYSPLRLSLKDKCEVNEGTGNKLTSITFEKENKISSQNELKHIWKLETKRNGNPIDLLKKSKQTTLGLKFQEEKVNLDITTLSSLSPKKSNLNLTSNFSPEVLNVKSNNVPKNICETNIINENQMIDSCNTICSSNTTKESISKPPSILNPSLLSLTNNDTSKQVWKDNLINKIQIDNDDTYISLNHFNKVFESEENLSTIVKTSIFKPNKSTTLIEKHNQSCDEIICSPIKESTNEMSSKNQRRIPNTNLLDSFNIIPGLNNKQNNLPNYKFKEDPVRKHKERKLLNGWDCEECWKFYKVNNDNPIEAQNAMNHFSRHRSVKHQHHAPTPPGFWDPT